MCLYPLSNSIRALSAAPASRSFLRVCYQPKQTKRVLSISIRLTLTSQFKYWHSKCQTKQWSDNSKCANNGLK